MHPVDRASPPSDLTFRFSDLPDFRGDSYWTYLQLEVFHPSQTEPVGYLRVALVTQAMAERMNQERLLLLQTKGHMIYPRPAAIDEERRVFRDPTTAASWKNKPESAARYVMETVLHWPYDKWNQALAKSSPDELVALVETNRPWINQATQENLDALFDFALNKADVDYIHLEDSWQGQGIAPTMYQAMSAYLDERFRATLNASTCQTPQALRCWQRMEAQGMVRAAANGRRYVAKGVSAATLEAQSWRPEPMPMPVAAPRRRRALGRR